MENDIISLDILQTPNDILYKKSIDVMKIDEGIKKLVLQMCQTMYENHGIGLAAPQVGYNLNIFVIDLQKKNKDGIVKHNPYYIINPKIIYKSEKKMLFDEGCLSVKKGSERVSVERYKRVKIKYLDLNGQEKILKADSDLMSACIQHEYDHLLGITIQESGTQMDLSKEKSIIT